MTDPNDEKHSPASSAGCRSRRGFLDL